MFEKVSFSNDAVSGLFSSFVGGLISSFKSILHSIPIPFLISFGIFLLLLGVFSFLKALKVIA